MQQSVCGLRFAKTEHREPITESLLIPDIVKVFQLFVGKHRAVFAGVETADPAMPAFTQAAGHILFHRQI